MRRWLEEFEQFAIDVILERRYGKRAAIMRWVLYAFSFVYLGLGHGHHPSRKSVEALEWG